MSVAIGFLLLFFTSLVFFSYPRRSQKEEDRGPHIYGRRYSDRYRRKVGGTLFPSGYDSALRASVQRDLSAHRGLSGVAVSVHEGKVRLEGKVKSEREAAIAASLAGSVPFVRGVENQLSWNAAREQAG